MESQSLSTRFEDMSDRIKSISAFEAVLLGSTLLACTWFGMMYFTAVVMMPGFASSLSDKDFLQAFKAIDSMFQQFGFWVALPCMGSLAAVAAATVLGAREYKKGNASVRMGLLYAALALYIPGFISTGTVNVPLNNQLQALDLDNMSDDELYYERLAFEAPWNFWNVFRVVTEGLTCSCLLLVIFYYEHYG